jgi:hypothetical protein
MHLLLPIHFLVNHTIFVYKMQDMCLRMYVDIKMALLSVFYYFVYDVLFFTGFSKTKNQANGLGFLFSDFSAVALFYSKVKNCAFRASRETRLNRLFVFI